MTDQPDTSPAVAAKKWQKTRKAKGLTLEDVCAKTNIPVRKLEAIEKGDFDALGMQTFAVGYIRNYARIIGENPDACSAVYYETMGGEPDASAAVLPSPDEKAYLPPKDGAKIPLLPISLGAIAIWVLVMVLMPEKEGDSSAPQNREHVVLEPTPTKMEDLITTATPMPIREVPYELGTSRDEQVLKEGQDQTLQHQTNLAASSTSTVAVSSNSEAPPADVSSETSSEPSAGDDTLDFSFSDDCWLEVRDADENVLVAQLKRKGDNLRLFGRGPFQVMMGNADAVELKINGQAVATAPLGVNKTRRMTVASPDNVSNSDI